MSRQAHMAQEERSRRQAAEVDVKRAELLRAAKADVEAALRQLGRASSGTCGRTAQPESPVSSTG